MAGIPQLEDEQPILQTQKVNSSADSHEAFAKTLGALSEESFKEAKTIATDKSQTMYINSVANVEQLKTGAQIRMIQHPDQAAKITEQTNAMMEEVRTNAYVNKSDRSKLNTYIAGTIDDVELKAAAITERQSQREAAFTHFANWPDQLQAYNDALIHDHAKAQNLHDAMISSIKGLVTVGALTPIQAASSIKTMSAVHDSVQNYYNKIQNSDTTAQEYHSIAASPLMRDKDHSTAPINASTGWLIDHHNGAKTFQDVESDIYRKIKPSAEQYQSLSPHQQLQAEETIKGVQLADGMINSGQPFPVIEQEYNSLNVSGRTLTVMNQAKRNALGNYIKELKNGNYLSVMAQTPIGNAIMNDFTMRDSAIKNTMVYSPEGRQKALLENKNKMVNEAVSYADATSIPEEHVQPIPQSEVAIVQNSFKFGEKPENALQILSQYTKSNQAYVANSLKNTNQRVTMLGVALSGDSIKPTSKIDFIAAQQDGRRFFGKNIEDTATDKTLSTRISNNLAPALRIANKIYNREDSGNIQIAMVESTLKYAKYLAQQGHPDDAMSQKEFNISISQWKNYVDEASRVYASAFQQMSGTNWMVNAPQIPQPLTHAEMDVLADHVTNEGYKYLKKNRSDTEYESATGRNPLIMIVSPTNNLQAVDGYGKVYYTMPFTSNTLPYAQESVKTRQAELKRLKAEAAEKVFSNRFNVPGGF